MSEEQVAPVEVDQIAPAAEIEVQEPVKIEAAPELTTELTLEPVDLGIDETRKSIAEIEVEPKCFEFKLTMGADKSGKPIYGTPQLVLADSVEDAVRIINSDEHAKEQYTAAELNLREVPRLGRPVWEPPVRPEKQETVTP